MKKILFFNYPTVYTLFVTSILLLFTLNSCTKFTDIKIEAENGQQYTAHVIHVRLSVPDTGEVVPIIKTISTDGWIYNSKAWSKKDARSDWFSHRDVVIGKVIEITPPKEN